MSNFCIVLAAMMLFLFGAAEMHNYGVVAFFAVIGFFACVLAGLKGKA